MSSYALHAKQTELRTTVQSLAEQSKLLRGHGLRRDPSALYAVDRARRQGG